ncbi:hemerythrin domain-containing protein [Actinopolymorpha sp. B11F2]|uniref:hemerythrin domain-containing protein n=1 Tax=Actinopolymorpha sp. B11F2 TaxID=3160862 RepID=UPI0032E38BA1
MTEPIKDDVVDLLTRQHNEIRSLFIKVTQAGGKEKREFFADLVWLLAVHEATEGEVVHPMARKEIDDGDEVIEHRLEEEQDAKEALAELHDLGVDHPEFRTKLLALAEAIAAHATYEEDEEFRFLRERVPPGLLQEMAGAVEAAQARVPNRERVEADKSTDATPADAPLAIFEHVHDAVREWRLRDR